MEVRVQVPASSANLGPGFDCLGLALGLYNRLTVREADRLRIETDGDSPFVPRDGSNLVVVAMNMAETHRFRLILRTSRGDRAVLLVTFGLTVLVDLTVAIGVGMALATFVFMHRMSNLATLEGRAPLIEEDRPDNGEGRYAPNLGLPDDVGVLTFRGPLFFGSAGLIKDAMDRIGARRRVYILRLEEVPMLDPTGALAFADLLGRIHAEGAEAIVVGAGRTVLRSLMQATPRERLKHVRFVQTIDAARGRVEAA